MASGLSRRGALLALAQLCDVFPHARLDGASMVDGRILRSGVNTALAACFGPRWVELSGTEAVTACCLAAAIEAAGDVPPLGSA